MPTGARLKGDTLKLEVYLNSVLFFLIFTKFTFYSKTINWHAKSTLAIYLIQENRPLFMSWDDNSNVGRIFNKIISNIRVYSSSYIEVIL